MKLLTRDEILHSGNMWMLYGGTKVGKTTSILQSAPDPILYLQIELKSLRPSIDAANRPNLDIEVAVYEDFEDLMEFLSNLENMKKCQTIVLDSLTHLSNVELSFEIGAEIFTARTKEDKKKKPLINRTKLSQEGYGGLAGNLFRVTNALGKISQIGKLVVCTCLLSESPKYDRELVAGPALKGREYPDSMPGFFDMIGLVTTRYKNEVKVYPPLVQFESPDENFMAGFTGILTKTSGPLNIIKILETNKQQNKEKEGKV